MLARILLPRATGETKAVYSWDLPNCSGSQLDCFVHALQQGEIFPNIGRNSQGEMPRMSFGKVSGDCRINIVHNMFGRHIQIANRIRFPMQHLPRRNISGNCAINFLHYVRFGQILYRVGLNSMYSISYSGLFWHSKWLCSTRVRWSLWEWLDHGWLQPKMRQ
jgi:hypothetical protein